MNRVSLTAVLILLLSVVVSAQTFVEFDRISWASSPGALMGVSAEGNAWDATANGNCDATGSWGPSGSNFVIEDWEGATCGCGCVAGDPTPSCGENDNTILIPAAIISGYCQVRVSFTVSASGGVECGTADDKLVADFTRGCPTDVLGNDWAGTDGMIISLTTQSGVTAEEKICGNQGTGLVTFEFDVEPFDAVGIIINAGTQQANERYEIGDIIFSGVEREIITLNTTCVTCDPGNVICENSGAPITLQTIANAGTSTFNWTGPNGFTSSSARPEISNYTTTASGDYVVSVTEAGTCMITETLRITVLPASDATCRPQAVFPNLFQQQCSDVTLPSQDETGRPGTWSPSNMLSLFPDSTLTFTFTPDDTNISAFQIELEIADFNALEVFGVQPSTLPVFCSQSAQTYDLITLFNFNLDVLLQVNGDGNLFSFINNGDFVNNFESQFRNFSFLGKASGTRQFFIEGISTCGTNEIGFQLEIVDRADPIRIDTSLCLGDTIDIAGIKLYGGIGDTVLVDGGACDTVLIASVGLSQPGRMRAGRFFPGSQRSFSCGELVYFYDTIVSGQRGILVQGEVGEEPPLGPGFDTVFRESVSMYTLPFPAKNGCDSIVNFQLNIQRTVVNQTLVPVCEDAMTTFNFRGINYPVDAFENRFTQVPDVGGGCNFFQIIADVLPVDRDTVTSLNTRIFKQDQDTIIEGTLFNQSNPSQLIMIPGGSANGCNAFKFVELVFAAPQIDTINERICPGDGVMVGDTVFRDNVTDFNYVFPVAANNGGDSIANVTVEILVPVAQAVNETICREANFPFMGQVFDTSRTSGFVNLRSTTLNCDSIIFNVNLSFFNAPDIRRDTTFCEGGSVFYPEYNLILDESALTGSAMITTADGCDQRVFVSASVLRPVTEIIADTICRGESLFFGNLTLTETGQSAQIVEGSNGCDSTTILNLVVLDNSFFEFDTTVCAGAVFTFGGEERMMTGTYRDTLVAANGCDSIAQVNLTVNDPIRIDSMMTICAGDDFVFNGLTLSRDTTIQLDGLTSDGCSEITIFTLDVLDPIINTQPVVAPRCADGTTVTVGGNVYNTSGTYRDTFPTALGCDSIVVTQLILPDSIITPLDTTICGGDFITLNGQRVENEGITDVTYFASNGCDSIVRVNLSLIAPFRDTFDLILCPGDDFSRFNNRVSNPLNTTTSRATRTFRSRPEDGCDTTIVVNFTFVGVGQPTINTDICAGDSIVLGSQVFKESIVDNITYTDTFGCTRMVVLNLNVFSDTGEDLGEQVLCPGEGFAVGDSTYTETGPHVAILQTIRPFTGAVCDSTVLFSISYAPILRSDIQEVSICEGDSYPFGGRALTIAGTYFDTLTAASTMCDSIVELSLTVVAPVVDTIRNIVLCPGEQYMAFNGNVVINAGVNPMTTETIETFTSLSGCDTTNVVFITSISGVATSVDATICEGDSYALGDSLFTRSGSFTVALPHPRFACDSLVDLNLTVLSNLTTDLGDISICEGESFSVGGSDFTVANNYAIPIPSNRMNSAGMACDSLVTFNLVVNPIERSALSETICFGDTYLVGTTAYNASGSYVDTLASAAGCDSIVNLTLNVIDVTMVTIDTSVCFGETILVGGQTLDRTQMIDVVIPSSQGCDSIVYQVSLIVFDNINTVSPVEICPGQSVTVGANTYDMPGTYTDILVSSAGCDSTVRTILTFMPIPENSISRQACTGSTFDFGGQMLTTAGQYRDTLSTPEGCDSIVILDLTFVDQLETDLSVTICDGATFAFGGSSLNTTGEYRDTLTSSIGCDSIVVLDLTVTPPLMVDTEMIIGACTGVSNGSFIISDIPASTGPYTISGLQGITEAASLPVTVTNLATGTYNYTVTDANGCEASNTATITEDRSNAISINSVTVNPAGIFDLVVGFDGVATSVTWDNVPGLSCYDCPNPQATITEPTTFTVTVVDVEGCISIASITLRVDGVGNIYVPTAFNPDSEDGNDRFFIQGEDSDVFYDMSIFDRWGNLVYNVSAVQVNDRDTGWDGRWGIRELNPGVYVYSARIFKSNGIEENLKGDITIIR